MSVRMPTKLEVSKRIMRGRATTLLTNWQLPIHLKGRKSRALMQRKDHASSCDETQEVMAKPFGALQDI